MMYICWLYIFSGYWATVADGFAPPGPPLLPWENSIERGRQQQQHMTTDGHRNSMKESAKGQILWKSFQLLLTIYLLNYYWLMKLSQSAKNPMLYNIDIKYDLKHTCIFRSSSWWTRLTLASHNKELFEKCTHKCWFSMLQDIPKTC